MNVTRRHVVVVLLVLAVLGASAIAVATATDEKTLVVADADTGERLLEAPVDDGTEVTLAYTHSVEKTPVEDIYVVDGTELRMDRMVFYSHGAGLPTNEPIEETEDGFVVYPNASYAELNVVPGSVAGHELVVGDERYDLVARSDGPVVLSVDERDLSDRLSDPLAAVDRLEPDRALDSITTHR
ncbi:DUF1850 domain-containing protein [Halopiger xanaduensis]|uniref:DUF1850 domain-containing protein n=1 Tax=Halopiger xanaduensis (strain DSM 18323 / JCM 14033 / SH-6) TaxID=797210 RepID=F8DAL0_HALXS|nr:DUF1850 domain-containing protein [Halopiger xanaduensis]AEH35815.1 Domain of unknown function DUF1850 [Halopiger xanaduensis SH-6]